MITAAVVGPNGGLQRVQVAERRLQIAGQARAEAVEVGRVARGVDRRIAAPMERAVEADDVDTLGLAVGPWYFRAVFSAHSTASVPELVKNTTSAKVRRAQGLGQRLLLGDAVDVGDVPELLALGLQRLHQLGMAVAQAR